MTTPTARNDHRRVEELAADNQRLRRIVGIARAALKGEKP